MVKTEFNYRGLIVPVFTPFNYDEGRTINFSVISHYAKYLASKNIRGILVNGTTGEGTSLTVEERKRVTEAWVVAVKETKQHLMIQVGGGPLKDVKELAAHAESFKVHSLLCLPELYFKPPTIPELIEYLRKVSEAAPKTPLLYYHIPSITKVDISMVDFLEAVEDQIPTFAGIKFTSNNLEEAVEAQKVDSRFAVFLGSDVLMAPACTMGLDSFIMTSLNFIPELAFELLEFGKGNRELQSARKSQETINKVVKEIIRHGNWVETMKIAMSLSTNLMMGPPRAPLKLLPKDKVEIMASKLNKIGLIPYKVDLLKMYEPTS